MSIRRLSESQGLGTGVRGRGPGRASGWQRALLVACCLALLACTRTEPADTTLPEPAAGDSMQGVSPASRAPREVAMEIEASKSVLRAEARSQTSGGYDVKETRYYVGETLVLVEEIIASGGTTQSVAAYYLDDGRLVFFRGKGTRTIFVPGGAERREQYDIEIGYDFDGNVVDSTKIVNGSPAGLEPLDFEAPKARAGTFQVTPPRE